jgi:hypothetical protein
MQSFPSNLQSLPPRIAVQALPEGERDAAHLVSTNLQSFEAHVRDFQSALALYNYCQLLRNGPNMGDACNWSFIAARDGAMSVYHSYRALDGIRQTLTKAPTLVAMVNRAALKSAGKIFHERFSSFEDVRDAVAHAGEKTKTPEQYAKHSFSGNMNEGGIIATNVRNLTISNALSGRRYTNTWEGRIVTYELSQQSHSHLEAAKGFLWEAFRDAETATAARELNAWRA